MYFAYDLLPVCLKKEEDLSIFWKNIKNLILKNAGENPQTNVVLQIEKKDGTTQIVESHNKVQASKSFVDDLTRFLPLKNIHFSYKQDFGKQNFVEHNL